MKLIKADKEQFCFQLQAREKQILCKVLGLYPAVPAAHQRISRSNPRPEAQQLLNEALAAQRRDNKTQVEAVVKSFFHEHEGGYRFGYRAPCAHCGIGNRPGHQR